MFTKRVKDTLHSILGGGSKNKSPVVLDQLNMFEVISSSSLENDIPIHYKTRLRQSWQVRWNPIDKQASLSVPYVLKFAPDSVAQGLRRWAVLKKKSAKRLSPTQKIEVREIEEKVLGFIGNPMDYIEPRQISSDTKLKRWLAANGKKLTSFQPQGRWHNLEEIFEGVNRKFFESKLEAKITWSARVGGLSTHSVQLDGEGKSYHLIRISRAYDFPDVPVEVVGGVVYHECLHIAIPPYKKKGRRIVHGPEFRQRERAYPHYSEWMHWHRTEMWKKLKLLKRGKLK